MYKGTTFSDLHKKSDFSFYGNNVTWHSRIIDENDVMVNNEVSINTLEMGVDLFTQISEADEDSKRKLRDIEESGNPEDYDRLYDALKDVIYTACDDHISVAKFCRHYQLEYVDMTKVIGVRSGFNAAYLPVKL